MKFIIVVPGLQLHGPSTPSLLHQESNEGSIAWAPSLPKPLEILRILISQLSFMKGKIQNWMGSQTFPEMKSLS